MALVHSVVLLLRCGGHRGVLPTSQTVHKSEIAVQLTLTDKLEVWPH
jgi:hypothetical protein